MRKLVATLVGIGLIVGVIVGVRSYERDRDRMEQLERTERLKMESYKLDKSAGDVLPQLASKPQTQTPASATNQTRQAGD